MNLIQSPTQTMSSLEISELVESRHDSVKRTIERLVEAGAIDQPPMVDGPKSANQTIIKVYKIGKRDSYVIVAQLSPQFTARLVDRWQELEAKQQPALPTTYIEALESLIQSEKEKAKALAQLQEAQPAITFTETVTQSEHTYSFSEAGKKIQQRPRKFIEWLKLHKYITAKNEPYQRYIDQGVMVMHTGINHLEHEFSQGRVTTKGMQYFSNKLEGMKL